MEVFSTFNMIVKIHKSYDGRKVIAACDKGMIGKVFSEGSKQLDVKSSFYDGDEMDGAKLIDEIKKGPCHLNIVGKESVEFCINKRLVDPKNVIKIKGIPHAQVAILDE